MSGFGNFAAGAIGGAGAGVASIASRYIDDEIARNRAQALADIQHQTMVRGEEYMQSAPVQERRLGNERNLVRMRSQEALSSDIARASSPELRQAKIDDRVEFLRGTTPAEIESQNAIVEGTAGTKLDAERMRAKVMTPLEAERAGAISEAQWRARSEYDDRLDKSAGGGKGVKMSEAGKLQLQDLNKQDEALQKAINDGVAGGTLKQDPKDPAWQHFTRQKQALQVQKLRVFAREGLISGADDAGNLIAAGASAEELQTSAKQAQLIGGQYASDFAAAVKERLASRPQPAAAPTANVPAPNLREQRRAEQQSSSADDEIAAANEQVSRLKSEIATYTRTAAPASLLERLRAAQQALDAARAKKAGQDPAMRRESARYGVSL